ncbi:MAG: alpha-mannosidase [Hormoscilla sp.]
MKDKNVAAITAAIDKLRQLSQVSIISHWRSGDGDRDLPATEQWATVGLNEKNHIPWPGGSQVLWLAQDLTIPSHLQGYPLDGLTLRLALTWWAEAAEIFVNGKLVQCGDLFDSSVRVLLSRNVNPGDRLSVALRLVSPGHDEGALVRSVLLYEATNGIEPGFVADEIAVLQQYLKTFAPEKLAILAAAVAEIDWLGVADACRFGRSLSSLRENMRGTFSDIDRGKINLLGHAHLDLAWLWPVQETWTVAQNTFASVLKLQQEFPDLTFCHSTPALYSWIEADRPDLFAAIQQQVRNGRWEIVGGMWVEPELNILNGESIVRQVLYSQRYLEEKFGIFNKVAWLPDSFGFCWQLPQILKQGGIEYFVTQKLRWNDTTAFPYDLFWWQAPDGSQILSLMSANIGSGFDPVKMASYATDLTAKTGLADALWLMGVGDHGGGPTRDMLEITQRWQQSPFFPDLEFTTAHRYLHSLGTPTLKSGATETKPACAGFKKQIPVWNDELYLEFHRGCYTTHGDQKLYHRRCEELLYQAELYASIAAIVADVKYPQKELESAWKKVLFNQFHDILPGTSIPQVYVDADRAWQEVTAVGKEILQQSLGAIASQITLPPAPQKNAQPMIIFNPLNWSRSELVAFSLPKNINNGNIYDILGNKIPVLMQGDKIIFAAQDIPSLGYRIFWFVPQPAQAGFVPVAPPFRAGVETDFVLENAALRVVVDPETGDLSSIFDKIEEREILKGNGNQLQAFQDRGQYWDAWNIDPNYAQHPLPGTALKSIVWLASGEVQQRVRVVRHLGESEFVQDYILDARSPLLKITTKVDWQERHVLVKAAFPLNLEADYATYEIPCGHIRRPTKPQTPREKAKWEVPALRWADLGDDAYGVSLLNDCKYGYDASSNCLRLTLLRGSTWPDPEADLGEHEFTYAIYPHAGSWQSAGTVRRGYELNLPLQIMLLPPTESANEKNLPAVGQFLDLQAENLVLMAFKQSEDHPRHWIIRCYECHGEDADMLLSSDLDLEIIQPVDILERPVQLTEAADGKRAIGQSKIVSLAVKKASP